MFVFHFEISICASKLQFSTGYCGVKSSIKKGHISDHSIFCVCVLLDEILVYKYPLSGNIGVVLKKKSLYPQIWNSILDRHHVWRSPDPTLAIWTNFVRERIHFPPFFLKKDTTFCCSHLFVVHIFFLNFIKT